MKSSRWNFYAFSLAIPAIPYLLMIYYPKAIDVVIGFFAAHRAASLALPVYVHGWGFGCWAKKFPLLTEKACFCCAALPRCVRL
jgi:hypothetical protein